jgi:hypothetical protein
MLGNRCFQRNLCGKKGKRKEAKGMLLWKEPEIRYKMVTTSKMK